MSQDLNNWYTAGAAAKRLAENSNRHINTSYVRQLAEKGLVDTLPLGPRTTLYKKEQIDNYIVEARGVKANRAIREKRETKERQEA